MIASSVSRAVPDLSLARGADRGERDDVDLGPDPFGARDRPRRQGPQDRLQPVVARMMQMVGLGRREQDAVDAGAEDRGEARGASGAERAHDVGQRVLEIAERGRAGVERGERVDQHDLPIEPGEMIAKERPDDMRLIGLVAARHHRGERAGSDRVVVAERDGREGQRRRALEIARHEESAGRQGRERIDVVARSPEIGSEQFGDAPGRVLAGVGLRVEADERRAPFGRERRAGGRFARRQRLARPFGVGLVEERQVEQPFAGIVDEIERRGSTRWRPSRPRARTRSSGATRRCGGSIAASGGRARRGSPDAPRRRNAARRRPVAARASPS